MTAPGRRFAVRGLAHLAAGVFFVVGAAAALKGLWDAFLGAPEARFFSAKPWDFVTRDQWFRFAGLELTYGLACLALGAACRVFARRLPVFRDVSEHRIVRGNP
ncbi:MAG: hypothetical protein E6Q99_02035 [Elusimicrobia bacterium]|jgi:hypothetical protein|nr:MAG: hypothetical protein E6Q99_02035 [Elusimicrobiota bacterium]